VRELETLTQVFTRVGALVRAAKRRAELDERACVLEAVLRLREDIDRVAEQLLAGRAALDQPERTERDADRLWRAPRPGAIERVEGRCERLVSPAGGVVGERQMRLRFLYVDVCVWNVC